MEGRLSKSKEKGGAPKIRDKRTKELETAAKDPKQKKLSFSAGPTATVSKIRQSEECIDPDSAESSSTLMEAKLDFGCSSETVTLQQSPSPYSETTSVQDFECCTTEVEPAVSDELFNTTNTPFSLPSTCSTAEKIAFVERHPIQPSSMDCQDLPFKDSDFYFRRNPNGDMVKRAWLTCKVSNKKVEAFYCSICIAFSNSTSSFISGCTNFRHCYQAVNKHETSKCHCDAVNTFFAIKKNRNVDLLINEAHASKGKKEILQNIEVMKRIFDIVKLVAKQGFPFRAHGTNESLYNLNNCEINHGNFFDIVLFLSNYDVPLKNHIQKCILESEKRKKLRAGRLQAKQTAGQGSFVTLLSYDTVKKVILAIMQSMKASIVSEIGEKRFSIQVDSTQDVGVVDQATVVVRYVKEEAVVERLISVLPVKDASGRGLNELIMSSFQVLGLDYKKIAGESFDGAPNSAYVGLRAQIAKEVPNSIYIWCYSHLLNLCISDCCDVLEAKTFFGLLHRLGKFIGDSHKRMNAWRDQPEKRHGHEKLLRLQKIGEPRWWAKDKALNWLFGEKYSLFLDTLEVLVLVSKQCDSKTTSEAYSLSENLCMFKTILTAHLFLSIFDIVEPVSRYLQTNGLDYMVAWKMVETTVDQLKKIEFSQIEEKAKHFAQKVNDLMTERDCLDSLEVEMKLQERRIGIKKRMAGESSVDEQPISESQRFRVNVFRPVLDQIIGTLTERFSENKQLILDSQFLDPRSFDKIRKDPNVLEAGALQKISNLAEVDESSLKSELLSFANLFPQLAEDESTRQDKVLVISEESDDDQDDNPVKTDDDDDEWGSFEDCVEQETKCKPCKKCFLCCHGFLRKYSLCSAAFENLSVVYEYLLTLSFTQVACERAFSKLKLIKTRLRATMGQEPLEAFMIMSVERDLLELVQFPDVLEKIRGTSPLMRSLLTV